MARDTSTDPIVNDLIDRYVAIISQLDGWGVLADTTKAVYPNLGLPMPQEPFPAAYCYLAGIGHDWGLLHQGIRRDIYTISVRIVGGPITPGYKFVPEIETYKLVNAVQNELVYRPFLNDPTTNEAFRYVDPNNQSLINNVGRITGFSYGEQGVFAGIEIPVTVSLLIRLGRM